MDEVEREILFIDQKLKKLQDSLAQRDHSTPLPRETKESALYDSGMDTGRPSMLPRKSASPVLATNAMPETQQPAENPSPRAQSKEVLNYADMGARPKDKRPPRTKFSENDYLEPREKVPLMTEFPEDDYLAPSVTVRKAPRVRFPSPIRRDAHDTREKANKSTGVNMKPATYDGSIPWQDYHSHFET